MTTYIGGETSKLEKFGYIALAILMLAFLAYIPFMLIDKQQRLEQAWQTQGCEMYDTYPSEQVPAKCKNDFVDHYAPQDARTQPPAETK